MIKIQLWDEDSFIQIDSDDPDKAGDITYSETIPQWFSDEYLPAQYGLYGHMLDTDAIAPIDLVYALRQKDIPFEILEGAEMIEQYEPYQFPEGVLS